MLSPSALLKSVLSFQAGKVFKQVPGSSGKSKEEILIKKKKKKNYFRKDAD